MYSFTINTDASHDPHTKTGGWACWIKSNHYKLQASGAFPKPVANSSVAELKAIGEALLQLDMLISSQEYLRHEAANGILLYINTDSKFAIQAINGNIKRSKHLEIIRYIRSLTDGYVVDMRHVKAHTTNKDARSYVNSWCDKAAKEQVRKKMERINGRRTKKI